jgi:hypothetical protein
LTVVDVDRQTGKKFTPFCPKDSLAVESFLPGTEPKDFCPIHNPWGAGASPLNPSAPR